MSTGTVQVFQSTGDNRGVFSEAAVTLAQGSLLGNGVMIAATASYPKTHAVATDHLAAANVDRVVAIFVTITTSFAAGNGAAPIFDFGQTGTAEKFKADLNSGSAGTTLIYTGTLSAGKALTVSGTAATGTGDGVITVAAFALPTV